MFDPVIKLTANEWGQVMGLISEGPWRVANPLLMKIGEQLRAQQDTLIQPSAPKGDGADMEEGNEQRH